MQSHLKVASVRGRRCCRCCTTTAVATTNNCSFLNKGIKINKQRTRRRIRSLANSGTCSNWSDESSNPEDLFICSRRASTEALILLHGSGTTRTLHLSGEENNAVQTGQAERRSRAEGGPPEDHQADLQQICPPRQLDQRLDRDQWSALHSSGPARGETPAGKTLFKLTPPELSSGLGHAEHVG